MEYPTSKYTKEDLDALIEEATPEEVSANPAGSGAKLVEE